MQLNPFRYQTPIAPDDLINRKNELAELLALVQGGHFVRLAAPRRYGKTSLLGKLAKEAETQFNMSVVRVDFYNVLSFTDLAIRLEDAYSRSLTGPVRNFVRDLLHTYDAGLTLGFGGLAARIESNPQTDPLPALHRLLDLPLQIAKNRM